MTIKQIQPGQAGVSNVTPSWVYIETDDTYATVTTTGYLSGAAHEYVNTFKNNMMALVSTKTSKSIGVKPVLYLLQLQSSANGVWSLVAPAVDVPIPFIVEGDIQAGSSGVAGKFISYPSTANSGTLNVAATNNTGGNFTNTITNSVSTGQSQTLTIPDVSSATANFIMSKNGGTQHITSGNLALDEGGFVSGISTGGTTGSLTMYPTTASKGTLSLTATANTGNTATSITNAAMGQASALTIPDPGAATADFVLAPSALVNGNAVKASGTAGLVVDGGYAFHAGTTGTYAGGGTSNSFSVTGMASSWIVTATILTQTNAASIVKAVPGTNALVVTFSADPGANTTINWIASTASV